MGAPNLDFTRALVRRLFAGVTDKGGKPYAEHCERVERLLGPDATEDERHAALLHDVLEDTSTTADDLRAMGYSARTAYLVLRLTRLAADGTYMDYIRGIAASGDQGLIRIKLADNADNSAPERIACLPPEQRDILRRYERARKILMARP
jgi:(p)ppGpp synthase/HD superfamily hydrolase